MLDNETKRRIDTARDILVGKVPDPKSQVEQITIALVYKFMDDMDKEAIELGGKPSFFTGDYERYAWSKIFDPRIGGHEMLGLYGEAIVKLNQSPNLPQLFRDIFKNAYLPYRDPETLKLFLKTINEFSYDHSERLGDAFEYLLSVLGSQGDAGQFRTPRHIIDFMVQVANPQKHESVMDPACGTAGFLISSYKHILKENCKKTPGDLLNTEERKKLLANFRGYDISPDMVRLSLVNMYLHGFVQPQIIEYDTLTSEDRWNEYADVILANPPFMTPKGGIKPHKKFSVQSNRSEVLFVDYIAEHLTPTGRAAVIVPEGIIFQSATAYKALRKMLVENHLYAVVSLPAGIFNPYSGVKTSILLMDRQLAKKTESILFVKIENDGFGLGAQRREIDKNDLPDAVNVIKDYVTSVRNGKPEAFITDEKPCGALLVKKEKLAESEEYNLTGDRYRTTETKEPQKWPMVELGEICDLYQPKTITSKDLVEDGKYKVFGANGIIGFYNEYNHEDSEVLVTCRGATCGTINRSEPKSWVTGNAMVVKPYDENVVYKNYLFYLLKNVNMSQVISGAAQPQITRQALYPFKIPLPPLEVQREIVAEIEGYQKLIDGCRQVVDSWKPQIDIDPEWPMVKLGDVCSVKGELVRDIKPELPYIGADSIESNTGQLFQRKTAQEQGTNGPVYYFTGRKLLYSKIRPYLNKLCLVDFEGYCSSDMYPLEFNDINYLFAFYYLLSDKFNGDIKGFYERASIPKINREQLFSVDFPKPKLAEQQVVIAKIETESKVIDGCRELIKTYEDKIKRLIDKVWEE